MAAPRANRPQQQQKERKKERGIVFSVPSGDRIILLPLGQPNKQGPPEEKELVLKSLMAPRMGNQEKDDEPFAWASREFLRKRLIGKTVDYIVDYKNPNSGREYGTIFEEARGGIAGSVDISYLIVENGWARVWGSDETTPAAKEEKESGGKNADLLRLERTAREQKVGLWTDDEEEKQSSKRKQGRDVDAFAFYEENKNKTIHGIVEYISNGSTYRITVLPSSRRILLRLAGVQCPIFKRSDNPREKESIPEPYAREAKFFADRQLLHRDVNVVLTGADSTKYGDSYLYGTVSLAGGNSNFHVGSELLRTGLGRFTEFSALESDRPAYAQLQKAASEANVRIWSPAARAQLAAMNAPPAAASAAAAAAPTIVPAAAPRPIVASAKRAAFVVGPGPRQFSGRVKEIGNGGSLVIEDGTAPSGSAGVRYVNVNLAGIQVPRLGGPTRPNEPFAWEAREVLRKKILGKKVDVTLDYVRPAMSKRNDGTPLPEPLPEKAYHTVVYDKANMAELLIERGLATIVRGAGGAGGDRSAHYLALVAAENRAQKAKKGLHADTKPTPHRVSYLAGSSKQAKNFLPSLKRAPRTPAIVEYVYAGARFSVYIPLHHCQVTLSLYGVRAPSIKDNEPFAETARAFADHELLQRDVEVEIEDYTKGNFLGYLWSRGRNFSATLLDEGLARIDERTGPKARDSEDLTAAEHRAKVSRKNIWHDYDEARERAERERREREREERSRPRKEKLQVLVTEVVDGAWFYVQVVGEELKQLAELAKQLQVYGASETVPTLPPNAAKKGDLLCAQFSDDGQWYRARVQEVLSGGTQYAVLFVDYGNCEVVPSSSVKPLAPELAALPPQAHECYLAYVRVPRLQDEYGKDAAVYFKELVWDRELVANVEQRDEAGRMHLTLGDAELLLHVNSAMLKEGYGKLVPRREPAFAQLMEPLKEEQDYARTRRLNIWQDTETYGEDDEEEEDEY